jgi:hypothetical protein
MKLRSMELLMLLAKTVADVCGLSFCATCRATDAGQSQGNMINRNQLLFIHVCRNKQLRFPAAYV